MATLSNECRDPECDLVMKGGITSGLVYPGAIARIARQYRLRNIGGTSAGAIAAAAAAAMEYGRFTGRNPDAVNQLAGIPAELGRPTLLGSTVLNALFAADRETAALFPLGTRPPGGSRLGRLWPLAGDFMLALLAVPLVAGGLIAAAFAHGPNPANPYAAALAGVLVWVAALAFMLPPTISRLLDRVARRFLDNGNGLVTGLASSGDEVDRKPIPGITSWLHAQIQSLAGLRNGPVLTFRHLWNPLHPERAVQTGHRQIDLVLVASDLNRLLSVSFPFLPQDERLFIDRRQWARLFPRDVLKAVYATSWSFKKGVKTLPRGLGYTAAHIAAAAEAARIPLKHLWLLPRPEDLPVLVAARASMAFPGLFTPLPLQMLRIGRDGSGDIPTLSEILLSDGGITSNFPIHLFDAPLPGRPTFALNLVYPGEEIGVGRKGDQSADEPSEAPASLAASRAPDAPASRQDLFMPRANNSRIGFYKTPSTGSPLAMLSGFVFRVIETARVWGDISLFDQPGTRDRIIHIRLAANEGGFNLGMDQATIDRLARKGDLAGEVLAKRFDPVAPTDLLNEGMPVTLNWQNHRFVRLRTMLAAQHLLAHRFAGTWQAAISSPQTNPDLPQLLAKARRTWPPGNSGTFPIGYSAKLTNVERGKLANIALHLEAIAFTPLNGKNGNAPPNPPSLLKLRPASNDPRATRI